MARRDKEDASQTLPRTVSFEEPLGMFEEMRLIVRIPREIDDRHQNRVVVTLELTEYFAEAIAQLSLCDCIRKLRRNLKNRHLNVFRRTYLARRSAVSYSMLRIRVDSNPMQRSGNFPASGEPSQH